MRSVYRILIVLFFHFFLVILGILYPLVRTTSFRNLTGTPFDQFMQWDSLFYSTIAQHGYSFSQALQKKYFSLTNVLPFSPHDKTAAFFPGLPIVIHYLSPIGALLLIILLFIVNLTLFYHWVNAMYDEKTAFFSMLLFAVNPGSFYFTALYPETFLVLGSLLIAYGLRRINRSGDRLAYLVCFFVGFFHKLAIMNLVFGLVFIKRKQYGKAILYTILCFLPWIIFSLYLEFVFGHPLAFITAESAWGRTFSFPFVNLLLGLWQQDWLNGVYMCILVGLLIRFLLLVWHEEKYRMITIYTICYAIVIISSYTKEGALMSVLRLFGVIWPIYIYTRREDQFRIWKRYIPYFLLFSFSLCTFIGSVLATHGHFFE